MKRYKAFLGLCLAVELLSGCTDSFDDMNTNPGAVTEANLKYVLPYVEEMTTRVDCSPYQRGDNLYAQLYCQYFSNTTSGFITDRYGYVDDYVVAGFWTPYYSTLKHMKVAKVTAANNPDQSNILQMIRIMTAKNTIEMTDMFGDIPYSQAGLGETQNVYDTQRSIYVDVFKELTEAADALSQNLAGQETCSADNDLIFAGDTQKWMRLANSLRLRAAMRLRFIDPDLARQEGEAAIADGLMQSNDDNAYIECRADASSGWGHPLYMMATWQGLAMSDKMEDVLKHTSTVEDPRMELWFGVSRDYAAAIAAGTTDSFTGEKFSGLPNGMNTSEMGLPENALASHSEFWGLQAYPDYNTNGNADIASQGTVTLPLKIMTYSEVCLLRAEAALAGWTGAGDAQQNYEEGIRASFEDERSFLDDASLSSTANDEAYIAGVALTGDDENKLEQIITQKWLALYPSGVEAWAECRRTGYPELIPVLHSDDPNINPANGEFIKKIRYIDSERRENAANATSPSLNQGQGDGSTVRVWWDTARYK